MSAISGVCQWDQRPVREATIAAFSRANRRAGPDGGGVARPRVGLVLQSHLLHFDRHSSAECQPLTFAGGSVLTWDGRLDNREDLLIQLDRDLGPDRSDAAIVAAAYARWGIDTLPRLIGDWSVAVWDAPAQRLILARDYMGNRPLFYLVREQSLVWSTCLDGLVEGCQLNSDVNDDYIAAKLTGHIPHGLTPFTGVRMLPAGHRLVATSTGAPEIVRYWTFGPVTIHYARPGDYADRLRELFTEAVRVRLRSTHPVWAHLSGGWDSSTNVCLAQRLIQQGVVEAPAVVPLTLRFADSPEYDEGPYVRAVEDWCGLRTTYQAIERYYRPADVLSGVQRTLDWGRVGWEEQVRQAGGRLILSGLFGDTLTLAGIYLELALVEHLTGGHVRDFLRHCVARSRHRGVPVLATFAHLVKTVLRRHHPRTAGAKPLPGVAPSLIARARALPMPAPPSCNGFSRPHRKLAADTYWHAESGLLTSTAAVPDLWWTYPYSHRPLVEFFLGAPPFMLWNTSAMRPAMKAAVADVLPPEVQARIDKGDATVAIVRSKRRLSEDLESALPELGPATQWHLVTRGYVNGRVLADLLRTPKLHVGPLLTFFSVEAWLRLRHVSGGARHLRAPASDATPLVPPLAVHTS